MGVRVVFFGKMLIKESAEVLNRRLSVSDGYSVLVPIGKRRKYCISLVGRERGKYLA